MENARTLSEEDEKRLEKQNSRIISDFKALKLETDAQRNWDLFYKRNQTNFFKDRHWTTREFQELAGNNLSGESGRKVLLEVGCGVGNLVFPLVEEGLELFIYCCDFSPRSVQFVKEHQLYNEENIKAFQCDITSDRLLEEVGPDSVDIVSMVFVLSAIHPDKHEMVMKNLWRVLKPGGCLLFRDYGQYDMAMIRFGPGSKIGDNFYCRQDGTRSYFFREDEFSELGRKAGFNVYSNSFQERRTVNKKEGIDVPRIFLQSKLSKPEI